ncbi:MAG: SpoIIE family protein phosphatase [Gemmatimonadetes bacterium]|nr:SpoIIE family protein phosphatase [Gemmatimonadota bacterium]
MRVARPEGWKLPDSVKAALDDFRRDLGWDVHLWAAGDGAPRRHVYPPEAPVDDVRPGSTIRVVSPRDGPPLEVELRSTSPLANQVLAFLTATLDRMFAFDREVKFFTSEIVERYEEINLLYSISETLGAVITLEDAARAILHEVSDVMEARRAALWVFDPEDERLHLVAAVGEEGHREPIRVDDPGAVTARVFREQTPLIVERARESDVGTAAAAEPPRAKGRGGKGPRRAPRRGPQDADSFLSVPIRYAPPNQSGRTIGVVNLIGRRTGGQFTAGDQKLLSAIASQIGAAIENNRLVRESLQRERMSREMELAHDLQMKLLPPVDSIAGAEVAARCEPAQLVGGDFYQLLHFSDDRIGIMIGDVSSHGFPAALIMALAMSAAGIYAHQGAAPAEVLSRMHVALIDELESTEMYLTLFYGVIDPAAGTLTYANAGHPHAFRLRGGRAAERLSTTDPPFAITNRQTYHETQTAWVSGDDVLLLFTDGLSDAVAPQSRGEGESRVVEEVTRMSGSPLRDVVDRLFALAAAGGTPALGDDRTAVLIRG